MNHKMEPVATYSDGGALSTFGRNVYRLYPDKISVTGNRVGQTFDATIPLSDFRSDPVHLWGHGQSFRYGSVLSAVTSLLLFVSTIIFRPYQVEFAVWYYGGAALIAVGILGCVLAFRKIQIVRFVGETTGIARLDVFAHSRANRKLQEAFVSAIQRQIAECRRESERST